jgi:hypothetical protein
LSGQHDGFPFVTDKEATRPEWNESQKWLMIIQQSKIAVSKDTLRIIAA